MDMSGVTLAVCISLDDSGVARIQEVDSSGFCTGEPVHISEAKEFLLSLRRKYIAAGRNARVDSRMLRAAIAAGNGGDPNW
jgi:hypothetical protein